MFVSQPTPTPTPITLSPDTIHTFVDAAKEISNVANDFVQTNQVLGVIFAVVIVFGIVAIVYMWTHRSQTAASGGALKTMADAFAQSETSREKEAQNMAEIVSAIKLLGENIFRVMQDMGSNTVESLTAFSDATNRQADAQLQSQRILNALDERNAMNVNATEQIRTDLSIMTTQGSLPLQNLAQVVDRIDKEGTQPLREIKETIDRMSKRLDGDSDSVIEILKYIRNVVDHYITTQIEVEKRKTDSRPLPAIDSNGDNTP